MFVRPVGIEACGRKRALHAGLWLAARGRAMLACMLVSRPRGTGSVGPGARGQ